ncbi:MAG TPA: hypothetical protein VEA58_05400 [Anaerovoracaceae bacterium]|nr:hypothetical protein [Anaerovoracaceae bacterium]
MAKIIFNNGQYNPKNDFENEILSFYPHLAMKNKYYTPEIEEFHPGFAFEWYDGDEWQYIICPEVNIEFSIDDTYESISSLINQEKIRVKYLDLEDIKELGWKVYADKDREIFFIKNAHILKFSHDFSLLIYVKPEDDTLESLYQASIRFEGTIRNKSELRRLMKMLNIT